MQSQGDAWQVAMLQSSVFTLPWCQHKSNLHDLYGKTRSNLTKNSSMQSLMGGSEKDDPPCIPSQSKIICCYISHTKTYHAHQWHHAWSELDFQKPAANSSNLLSQIQVLQLDKKLFITFITLDWNLCPEAAAEGSSTLQKLKMTSCQNLTYLQLASMPTSQWINRRHRLPGTRILPGPMYQPTQVKQPQWPLCSSFTNSRSQVVAINWSDTQAQEQITPCPQSY